MNTLIVLLCMFVVAVIVLAGFLREAYETVDQVRHDYNIICDELKTLELQINANKARIVSVEEEVFRKPKYGKHSITFNDEEFTV